MIARRANTTLLLASIKLVKKVFCLFLNPFCHKYPQKGVKKGPFWPWTSWFGSFLGSLFWGIQKGVEKYADFNLGAPSRVKKRSQKGLFGVIWGSKGLFWALFGGPYLRSLKKGLQKRPIGAKTCSARPISCKKGPKRGSIWGPFEG